MSNHDAFLRKILENPADDGPRRAYADWLEERGEIERAEFLRFEHLMLALPVFDRRRAILKAHLEELPLESRWVATVSKAVLENCRFEFTCPGNWDCLQTTVNKMVRFCEVCQESVRYCHSIEEARNHVLAGRCVAINPTLPRSPGDLERRRPGQAADELVLGRMTRSTRVPTRRATLLHRILGQGQP